MSTSVFTVTCPNIFRHQLHQPRSVDLLSKGFRNSVISNTKRHLCTTGSFAAAQVAGPKTKSSSAGPPSTPPSRSSARPPSVKEEPGSTPSFGPAHNIAQELRRRTNAATQTYVAYGVCDKLVKECARQADYRIPQAGEKNVDIPKTKGGEDLGVGEGWWYDTLGLTPTFNTWAQITFLHMYFLTCRFRCFPSTYASSWHQHLLDHFFYLAEEKMTIYHHMVASSVRNKYLKDLYVQWRGVLAAYDEGLVKGDAVFATAIWRNIFKAEEDVNFTGLGQIVSYSRGVIRGLDHIEDEGIAGGEVVFGNPGTEREGVVFATRMLDAPFEKAAA